MAIINDGQRTIYMVHGSIFLRLQDALEALAD
jgi:hypothetical protein